MTITEKLQALFAGSVTELTANEPEAVKLATAKLENGQEVETTAEAFVPGSDVFVTNDQGEQIALPNGVYTLEDGTQFEVMDGIIQEAAQEEEVAAELEAQPEPLTREEVAGMIQEAVLALSKEVEAQLSANAEQLEKLSAQPAAKVQRVPTQAVKLSREELAKMPLDLRIKTMIKQFN
jgi:hypothetical protein